MTERNPYYVSRTTSNAGLILLGQKIFYTNDLLYKMIFYTDHLKHFMIINKYAFNYL